MQYGLLDIFYLAKTVQDCGLNSINSTVELITVKNNRTICCYGSEVRFTDQGSALYCVYSFKNKHKKYK